MRPRQPSVYFHQAAVTRLLSRRCSAVTTPCRIWRLYPYMNTLFGQATSRSEEHTSELQSRPHLVCRLLLEKKKHTCKLRLPKTTKLPGNCSDHLPVLFDTSPTI